MARLSDTPDGLLHGSVAVRAYISRALATFPDLHFVLLGVYNGVNSVVLHYQSVNNLVAAEYFQFDERGKISRIAAHYS